MDCSRRRIGAVLLLLGLSLGPAAIASVGPGERLQVVPFGTVLGLDDSGLTFTVTWDDPRDIASVEIEFAEGDAPPPGSIRIEYWLSAWPAEKRPRDRASGAGVTGWINLGDPYQGKWQVADTLERVKDDFRIFSFQPANAIEFPQMARDEELTVGDTFGVQYRTTHKIRCRSDRPLAPIRAFRAYTDSILAPMEIDIVRGGEGSRAGIAEGKMEVHNGYLERMRPLHDSSAVSVSSDFSWKSLGSGPMDGLRAFILYAMPEAVDSFDRTVVTIRSTGGSFSFAPDDLLEWGHIFSPDHEVLIRRSGDTTTYEDAFRRWKLLPDARADVFRRIQGRAEQSVDTAWRSVPDKRPHEIPLGFEGGRQHFQLNEYGRITADKGWIEHLPGKDTERCLWEGYRIEYDFGLPDHPRDGGGVENGYLPLMVSRWSDSGRRFTQSAFVVPLHGIPEHGGAVRADDPLVLVVRIQIDTRTEGTDPAEILRLRSRTERGSEHLVLRGDVVHARGPDGAEHPRMLVGNSEVPGGLRMREADGEITFHVDSVHETISFTVDFMIPFVTLGRSDEIEILRSLRFDTARDRVLDSWEKRLAKGTRLYTPDRRLDDFYRGFMVHALLNLESHVADPDLRVARVGSILYGLYGNESAMMVAELDRRGFHDRAERALATWLTYQGTVKLPGKFLAQAGILHGAGGYEDGGYNQDHGWILWCLVEHFRYTRDREWLESVAPNLIRASEWIRSERSRREDRPVMEHGLLPPGRLEDVKDWGVWLTTNVYAWLGIRGVAMALDEIGHPSADAMRTEANEFREDILRAFREARIRSPLVRLRDGSWIPHVPAELYRRGRSFGWLRETLQGALHLVCTGIIDPEEDLATWILRDYEDNLFLSERFGYRVKDGDFENTWFHRGGISMQANLLCTPTAYLLRDQPRHFLRGLFNAFAASYFPDTGMMTEHALPEIGDWQGDHFKTSDEANVSFWLRSMFLQESGTSLEIGAAVPRSWFAGEKPFGIERAVTHFGPASVRYRPRPDEQAIEAVIDPPRRNPPERLVVRFRHPEKRPIRRCEVNGRIHRRFDVAKEWVEVEPLSGRLKVVVYYDGDSSGIR